MEDARSKVTESEQLTSNSYLIKSYMILQVYKIYYNIASRATQSNSVYISVLQISIVHSRADGVTKLLSQ